MSRPNILFLMSDEHRADVVGFGGDAVVRTPRLDALAATGVVFANAYTPSPICIPGRQCLMSGQLPRTCRTETFWQDLAPGYMTFARRLGQYAYRTVAAGKLHHTGPDAMQGWSQRIGSEIRVGDRCIENPDPESFARVASGQLKWSDAKEVLRAGVGRPPSLVEDEYALQGALHFIEAYFTDPYFDRATPTRPLLLKVSFNQPHYPYHTDQAKFEYYLNRVHLYLDQEVFDHPFLSQRQVRPGVDVTERDMQRATAAYYGMIESIDGYFGQILDALTHVGQNLDEWIIVYTADHGEMLGEHGIWEKQKFFEASARVPLCIRWPQGLPGGRTVTQNVNLCDLFATLCELTDIETPEGLDSRSLVPLCHGDAAAWANETVSQFGGTNLMIKQDDLKYQYYGEDMPEVLFDLAVEPGEHRNLIDEPRYAAALQDLRARRGELGFGPNAVDPYWNAGYA